MNATPLRQTMNRYARRIVVSGASLAALAVAGCATNNDGGTICTRTQDTATMAEHMPEIHADLQLMQKLPLTGVPIASVVVQHNIMTCYPPNNQALAGGYQPSTRVATFNKKAGTGITFHELFHAMKHLTGAQAPLFKLTVRDAAVGLLLHEASAVAYELAAQKEASIYGLKFTATAEKTTASDPANIAVFEKSFQAAWKMHAVLEHSQRIAQSLEVAGQDIVRHLMNGNDQKWKYFYAGMTLQNVNMQDFPQDESKPGYAAVRSHAYQLMGSIPGSNIRFVPNEYMTPEAKTQIDQALVTIGLNFLGKSRTAGFVWSSSLKAGR